MTDTEDNKNSNREMNDAESLVTARAYSNLIVEIPSSFTSTVRTLILDQEKNSGKLSAAGRFLALRLLKGPSLLAPFYFAGLTYKNKELGAEGGPTLQNLVKVFSPYEISGLLGLIYLLRKVKGTVSEIIWDEHKPHIFKGIEIGGHLGLALPKIGFTMGLFCGGLGKLGQCLFQKHDEKAYKEYRRHLRAKKLDLDLQYEMGVWGCTQYNVASMFIQLLGYGVNTANSYSAGMSGGIVPGGGEPPPDVYRFKIASVWLDSLKSTGLVPNITHKGDYYPTKEATELLVQEIGIILEKGSKLAFLDKTKEDLSPEKTPYLFPNVAQTKTAPVEVPEGEVSEEVKNQIKAEDLAELDE